LLSACAIKYLDESTQTWHLIGIGHVKLRLTPPNEGVRALLSGNQTLGISTGYAHQGAFVSLGYDSQTLMQVMDDTQVRLDWASSSPFSIEVGTTYPTIASED